MAAHLHLFSGSGEGQPESPPPVIQVKLVELMPLIGLAARNNYAWLQDFLDDRVIITEDLYEVLRSFKALRPTA